ncbi:MAG: rhomboid family intramembrane serine protease [Lachnospiraceae bacterium]|nr:rhomboid family intramembrane serine protease [Lachnospiraceae bacterium]
MVVENVLYVLKENAYIPMGTNIKNMGFFYKNSDDSMNIAVIVNNYGGVKFVGEQLKEIAFQVERKFLLQGKRYVNIQFILLSDDIDRDRMINQVEDVHFWLLDMSSNRLIVYENELKEFEDLRENLENQIENMEFPQKNKKYSLPYVNICIIMMNIIIFIILEVHGSTLDSEYMTKYGAANWQLIFEDGQYYRLFTSMFLHFGAAHLINNMFSLFIVGNQVEKIYGKVKYIIIYIISGLGAGLLSDLYYMKINQIVVSAGASGAIFGIIGAMMVGTYFYNRMEGRGIGSRFLLLLLMALYSGSANVDNMAHVGGFITGTVISSLILYRDFKLGKVACKR